MRSDERREPMEYIDSLGVDRMRQMGVYAVSSRCIENPHR